MRLLDCLAALHPGASRRTLRQWLARGRVRVNGSLVRRADAPVGPEDRVALGAPPPPLGPLRLVWQDDDLLVVDKPPGLLTIATERERARTAYALLRAWVQGGRPRRGPAGRPARPSARVFIVHRLDRETSGLVVFARSAAAKVWLQEQFAARSVERVYRAVVEGRVREPEGVLRHRLVEDRALRVRPTRDPRAGREAITRYRVLERRRDSTVLELMPVTGRRGQLRAQLAAVGHPIVGDRAYGSGRDPIGRLCLHATRLGLTDRGGRRRVFESSPPAAFGRA